MDGQVTVRDLKRELNLNIPDNKASTIAGLVLYEARRIPEKGQVFVFYGLRFEVLEMLRYQIKTLRITSNATTEKPLSKKNHPTESVGGHY